MYRRLNLLSLVAGTIVSAACSQQGELYGCVSGQETANASFTFLIPESFQTRSHYILPEKENNIINYCVCIWDTEHPYEYPTLVVGPENPTTLPLRRGVEYIVAGVVNSYPVEDITYTTLSDRAGGSPLLENAWSIRDLSPYNDNYNALGMMMVTTNIKHFTLEDDMEIQLVFDRVFSRFEVSLDKSNLRGESVSVTSVRIKNTASSIQPFFEEGEQPHKPVKTYFRDGDYASEEDLQKINNGKSIFLYAVENLQGTLLPQNRDPANKNPDSIGQEAADRCTYMEIEAVHSKLGDITYRCYLGEDNCSNFDVARNTSYRVTIRPSADGLGASSWKTSY